MSASYFKRISLHTAVACALFCLPAFKVGAAEQNESQDRARAMMHKAEQLAKQGRVNEAEELARHAKKLLATPDNKEHIHQLTQALEEEVARLKEVESDDVKRHEIERQMDAKKKQELPHRKLDPRERKSPHGEQRSLHEAAQRLQHLRQAAEHLKAAGMPDMAKEVGRHAEEIEHHIREEHARHARAEHEGAQDHRDREIEELRREMKELRQELRAVSERLKN